MKSRSNLLFCIQDKRKRVTLLKTHLTLFLVVACSMVFANEQNKPHTLWSRLSKQPYNELPNYKVSSRKFGKKGDNAQNILYNAAKRTLTDSRDWLENARDPKLFNANGICFFGKWVIENPSMYTGAFQKGATAYVIARASVALSGTTQKHKRAFGFALKLFDSTNEKTANAFVMHSMAGTKTQHVLALTLDNEPELGGLPPLTKIPTLIRINKDLERADAYAGASSPNATYRPLSELAMLNHTHKPVSPTWLKLVPATQHLVDKDDFRDELNTLHYPDETIMYHIEVASGKLGDKQNATWKKLGRLVFNNSVTSRQCDINLHFSHPTL